jgi:RNA polymerase sigma-70 factor (ECF subfamily)
MYATLDIAAEPAGAVMPRLPFTGRRPVSESPLTRLSLLERVRDTGNTQAWEEFVDLYAPLVYRLARRYGLQDADAADLTQEALGVAARALPTFVYDAERGTFRGWLLAVARNLLGRFCRQRQKQPPGGGDSAVQALLQQQPAPDESERWEREYRQRLFECAAERVRRHLRPTTWDAFWRTAVVGEDVATVAESLDLSLGAVYIARTRVLARVRAEVQRLEGD